MRRSAVQSDGSNYAALLNGTIIGSFFSMAFCTSYRFCISSQNVLLPPKAGARRKDISAVISDRQRRHFDTVRRDTWSRADTSVTVSSTITSRNTSPGWGTRYGAIRFLSFPMVILIIQQRECVPVKRKSEPPISTRSEEHT